MIRTYGRRCLHGYVFPQEASTFRVQQSLSPQLRNSNWNVRVAMRESEIVALGAPSTRWLGLAADIGTTKIAVYLVDMESGRTLASKGLMNPQISYGEDVVSRIFAAGKSVRKMPPDCSPCWWMP